jgi:hypothetical protein
VKEIVTWFNVVYAPETLVKPFPMYEYMTSALALAASNALTAATSTTTERVSFAGFMGYLFQCFGSGRTITPSNQISAPITRRVKGIHYLLFGQPFSGAQIRLRPAAFVNSRSSGGIALDQACSSPSAKINIVSNAATMRSRLPRWVKTRSGLGISRPEA